MKIKKKADISPLGVIIIIVITVAAGLLLGAILFTSTKELNRIALREDCKRSIMLYNAAENIMQKGRVNVLCYPHEAKIEQDYIFFKPKPDSEFVKDKSLAGLSSEDKKNVIARYVADAMHDCYYQFLEDKTILSQYDWTRIGFEYYCAICDTLYNFEKDLTPSYLINYLHTYSFSAKYKNYISYLYSQYNFDQNFINFGSSDTFYIMYVQLPEITVNGNKIAKNLEKPLVIVTPEIPEECEHYY